MALGTPTVTTSGSGSGAGPFTTASWTPSNNNLYLCYVMGAGSGAFSGNFAISGNGLTWVSVAQQINASDNTEVVQLFRALVTSGASAGTASITAPVSMASVEWIIIEVTGASTSGTNGSGAVPNSAENQTRDSGSPAAFSITIGTLADATNDLTIAGEMSISGVSHTPGINQTSLTQIGAPGTAVYTVEYARGPPVAGMSFQSTGNFEFLTGIAVDVTPGASAPTINTQPANARIFVGQQAVFSVTATTSGGALSYQWQDNRTGSFANVVDGTGGTSATYTTPTELFSANGRLYQVNVTDSNGTATSSNATLIVVPYPTGEDTRRNRNRRDGGMNWGLNSAEWW